VVTISTSTISASSAAKVFPTDPSVTPAAEETVLHVIFVAVNVFVVQLLFDLGTVFACLSRC
jgi:hypothetical protein